MESGLIDSALARFRAVLGDACVLTDAADTTPHFTDWRGRYSGEALCVVRPGTVDELVQVVHICNEARLPMVPQGGNTGLCGGATPHAGRREVLRLTAMPRCGGD